jgi:hypothetical protein
MDAHTDRTSPGELFSEVGGLMTGLGVISFALFPFAVPLIALTALAALPLVLLAVLLLPIWLLARGVSRQLRRIERTRAGRRADAEREPRRVISRSVAIRP